MPKGSDPLCPLGFHPQFRRPNYCKRCFREHGEHKSTRESGLSGSTTSLNSLSAYDPNTKTKEEDEPVSGRRSISLTRTKSEDKDEDTSWGAKTWTKSRPMSWSAQDLRKAVDDAKETVRSSREDLSRVGVYGSSKSLAQQDYGSIGDLRGSSTDLSDDKTTSFSSYLAMRTKSPGRPPQYSRTSSLPSYSGTALNNIEERETKVKISTTVTSSSSSSALSTPPSTTSSVKTKSILKEDPEKKSPLKSSLTSSSSLSKTSSISEEKPPRAPYRIKDKIGGSKLPDLSEEKTTARRSTIQSLRTDSSKDKEVKSEDADAAYVIQLKPRSQTTPKKVEYDHQHEIERLQKENKDLDKQMELMNSKIDQLERENKELSAKKPRFGDLKKQTDVTKLQQKVDEMQDEVKGKNKKVKELEKEIEKRPLPKDIQKSMDDLRSKLQAAEQLCEELMDENEEYKKEVRLLEEEAEELQDNFREEQADEYRDLKRELEQRAKDCRVLQFKLKKSDRRVDTLERDKQEVEEKLRELQVGDDDVNRAEKIKTLEKEVGMAKEVSKKMHDEMEKLKKQLETAESERKRLKENLQDKPVTNRYSRTTMLRQGSQDNTEQLMRDLQATQEREQDIKEQLKFSEEETKNMRKKMSRLEEENETLQLQLNKMSTKAKSSRQRSMERSGSLERNSSIERGTLSRQGSSEKPPTIPLENDIDPTELKIQLELNEQESGVLRRKVEDLESENERLQKEIKEILVVDKKNDISKIPSGKKDNIIFEQKIRLLEKEVSEFRQKSLDLEKTKDQLQTDLDLAKKRAKVTRTKSTETTDAELKKRVETLDREIDQLRKKLQDREYENENLTDENNRLTLKCSRRVPLSTAENAQVEKTVLEEKLKRTEKKLKEANDKLNNSSTVSVNGNTAQIEELQSKIDELQSKCDKLVQEQTDLANMTISTDRISRKPKDSTPKTTLVKWVAELDEENARLHLAVRETDKRKGRPASEDLSTVRDLEDKLERERERNEELSTQLQEERVKITNKNGPTNRQDEMKKYQSQIDDLKRKLDEEKDKIDDLKSGGGRVDFEELRKAQTEKHKLQKDLEEERNSQLAMEERHKELTMSWLKERDEMKKELNEAKRNRDKIEAEFKSIQRTHSTMESKLNAEIRKTEEALDMKKKDSDLVKSLRMEKEDMEVQLDELRDTIKMMERSQDRAQTKQKKDLESLTKERDDLKIRMNTLESELKIEKKKRERLEIENDTSSKVRFSSKKREADDLELMKKESKGKIDELEKSLKKTRQENESLQNKYDLLEEEFVVAKAQFTMGKDNMALENLRKEYGTIEAELKTLRETYNLRQDTWIKEKLSMQEQLKTLEDRMDKASGDKTSFSERKQLRDIIDDKNQQIEKMRRDEENIRDQVIYYRRESEEMRRKVDDLEKIQELNERRQGSSSNDTSSYETTIRDLRSRLTTLEKTHKSESTKIKMKYDSKQKALTEEVSTLNTHMAKYRRERDTYKEMLDGAQKTITELKGSTVPAYRTSRADNATEQAAAAKRQDHLQAQAHLSQVQEYQANITELEDKLADAKLESARLRNEMVEQKTNMEILMCDQQSKINEYEEDRLLVGGSRRVPGLKTRLELNWQKEREEQQRLVQETATLAKDLRNTLYEVERERDMERLETKRKIEQLRRTVDSEHVDTKTKVHELQRDLMELREAHAKLRQINEKLRREKDRTEVEREAMRDKFLGSSRDNLNQQSKIERLLDEMRKLKELAPLVIGEGIDGRDSSLTSLPGDPKPKTKEEFTDSLKKMNRISEELKIIMNLTDGTDRLRRAHSFRRALSVESDDDGPPTRSRSATRGLHRGLVPRSQKSQLYRKAQSLDHQMAEERGKIWVSTDAGSTSSIDSTLTDDQRRARYDRSDTSLDRISTGSQTSDTNSADRKKTSGFKSMFSKLGKTKSIDETKTKTGSDVSLDTEKDTVKDKLKTFFKKNQSSTSTSSINRTKSMERDGPSVRRVANKFDSDTTSIASNTSLSSVTSETLPPVMRRLRSNKFGTMVKAQSISAIGRQGSFETTV